MKKLLFAALLTFPASIFAAEVYQCNVGGTVKFQSHPCAGASGTAGDRLKANMAEAKEKARLEEERLKRIKEAAAKSDIERAQYDSLPQPYIGMHSSTTTKWGSPTTKNVTTTARATREQWVYRGFNGKQKYLYFVNGVLTSISE